VQGIVAVAAGPGMRHWWTGYGKAIARHLKPAGRSRVPMLISYAALDRGSFSIC